MNASARLVDRITGIVVVLPFAAAIAWLHFGEGIPLKTFIFGSGSWGFGCIAKMALYHGVIRRLSHDPRHLLRTSVIHGLVSGATELGFALALFAWLPPLSFWEVVAFGVGIGTIEAVLMATPGHPLKGTALEGAVGDLERTIAQRSGIVRVFHESVLPVAERLSAGVFHVGTRGLAYVGYRASSPWPIGLALAAFLVADGILGYRLTALGRLSDLRVLRRVELGLAVVALAMLAAFLVAWPRG